MWFSTGLIYNCRSRDSRYSLYGVPTGRKRVGYREFYQCDADVVGSDSLLCEIELLSIIDEVFKRLGIRTVIKLNNRKY